MSALNELKKISPIDMTMLEFIVTQAEYSEVTGNAEHAADELAALRADLAEAQAERDALKEAIKKARIQLQATQINWQEECLFECNDILTAALEEA